MKNEDRSENIGLLHGWVSVITRIFFNTTFKKYADEIFIYM